MSLPFLYLIDLDLESRYLEFYEDKMNGLNLRVSANRLCDLLNVGSLENVN